MVTTSDTLLNTLFDGRYRILRKLGTGGMANVYLAEDEVLGRRVAIKILNDRHAGDDQFVERFRREAKNALGGGRRGVRQAVRPLGRTAVECGSGRRGRLVRGPGAAWGRFAVG